MIKIDTLYVLYLYSISTKIERNKRLIEEQHEKIQNYLPELISVKDTISKYVNYSDVLNGNISTLPVDILQDASSEIRYANIILKNYYELKYPIQILSDEIRTLSDKKISIKVYKEIIRKCNNKIGEWLIRTGGTFTDNFLGSLTLRHKEKTNRPNWGKSNKNKQAILDRGGIPYNKEDEKRCLDAGIPYHGEKWLDKDYPNGLLVIHWRMTSFIKQYIPDNLVIRFVATKGNYSFIKRISDLYLTDVDYSVYTKIESPLEEYKKSKNAIKK